MKRTFIILLLFSFLVGVLVTQKNHDDSVRTECIVQSNQVILNQFRDDVLLRSQSISGNKVTTWDKGNLKRDVRTDESLHIAHYVTLGQQNDQIIGLRNHASEMFFYGKVSSTCVEALRYIMSKDAP